mgnify:CR=1 FL=1
MELTSGDTAVNKKGMNNPSPLRAIPVLQVVPICFNSPEQALNGKSEISLEPPTKHEIPLNANFRTEDLDAGDFKPVYAALMLKLNGDDTRYNALCEEGRALADAVEEASKIMYAVKLQNSGFALMAQELIEAAWSQPFDPKDSPEVKVSTKDDKMTALHLAIPDVALPIWHSMPKRLFQRLFVGAALLASGTPCAGNWSQEEMSVIRMASLFHGTLLPAYTKARKKISETKDAYLTRCKTSSADKGC